MQILEFNAFAFVVQPFECSRKDEGVGRRETTGHATCGAIPKEDPVRKRSAHMSTRCMRGKRQKLKITRKRVSATGTRQSPQKAIHSKKCKERDRKPPGLQNDVPEAR